MRIKLFLVLFFSLGVSLSFGWQLSRSEHFELWYQEADTSHIPSILAAAESVYEILEEEWQRSPETITMILNGNTDQANGFFAFGPQRVALFLNAPGYTLISARENGWLEILILHELVHYFHLGTPRGMLAPFYYLLGPTSNILFRGFLPTWAIEGMAVEQETRFSSGGRGRNPLFLLPLRDALYHDDPWTLEVGGFPSIQSALRSRAYLTGYVWMNQWLKETEQSFASLDSAFSQFPFFSWPLWIESVGELTREEVWNRALRDLEKEWKEGFQILSGEPVSALPGESMGLPIASEKGSLQYTRGEWVPGRFFLEEEALFQSSSPVDGWFTVDGSGENILWAQYEIKPGWTGSPDLQSVLYQYFEGKTYRLSGTEGLEQPSLGPRGKRLFAVQTQGNTRYLIERDALGERCLVFRKEDFRVMGPRVSPDGLQLAFLLQGGGNQSLVIHHLQQESFREYQFSSPIYHLRWVSERSLALVAEEDGSLVGLLWDMDQAQPSLALEDPVGVMAWDVLGEEARYLTLREGAHQLMSKDLVFESTSVELLEASALSTPPPLEDTLARSLSTSDSLVNSGFSDPSLIQETSWALDLPRLHFHSPFLDMPPGFDRLFYGWQAFLAGVTGTHAHHLTYAFEPQGLHQIAVDSQFSLGPWSSRIILQGTHGDAPSLVDARFQNIIGDFAGQESTEILASASQIFELFPISFTNQRFQLNLTNSIFTQLLRGPIEANAFTSSIGLLGFLQELGSPLISGRSFGSSFLAFRMDAGYQFIGQGDPWGGLGSLSWALRLFDSPLRFKLGAVVGSSGPWIWRGLLESRIGSSKENTSTSLLAMVRADLQIPLYSGDGLIALESRVSPLGLGLFGDWGFGYQEQILPEEFVDLGAYLSGELSTFSLPIAWSLGYGMKLNFMGQIQGGGPIFLLGWNPGITYLEASEPWMKDLTGLDPGW